MGKLTNIFKKKNKIDATTSGGYQGPVQQGTSESFYRATGQTATIKENPISQATGTNVNTLKPKSSGGSGSSTTQTSNQQVTSQQMQTPTPTTTTTPQRYATQPNRAATLLATRTTTTIPQSAQGERPNYFQQRQELNRLQNQYQEKINSGKMSYEQASQFYKDDVEAYIKKNNPESKEGEPKTSFKEYLASKSTSYVPEDNKFVKGVKKVEDVGSNFIGVGFIGTPAYVKAKDIPNLAGKQVLYGSLSTDVLLKRTPNFELASSRSYSYSKAVDIVLPQTPLQVTAFAGSYALPVAIGLSKISAPVKSNFAAYVTREGETSTINTLITSKGGKKIIYTLSGEQVRTIGGTKFAGAGQGYYSSGNVIENIRFVGAGKSLGGGSRILAEGKVAESFDTLNYGAKASQIYGGEGVLARTGLKSSGRSILTSTSWNPARAEFQTVNKVIRYSSFEGIKQQKLLGLAKQVGDTNLYYFKGTQTPVLRIYKGGQMSYIVKNPNVEGQIQILQDSAGTSIKSGFVQGGTGQGTKLVQQGLTQSELQSVAKQVSLAPTKIDTPIQLSAKVSTTSALSSKNIVQEQRQVTSQPQFQLSSQSINLKDLSRGKIVTINPSGQSSRNISKTGSSSIESQAQIPRLNQQQPQVKEQKLNTKQALMQPLKLNTISKIIPRITPNLTFKFVPKEPKLRLSKSKQSFGGYGVEVRKQGKFIQVGKGLSLSKAYSLGTGITQFGLSQSFRITGGKNVGTPKGYYSNKGVFIEKSKSKINTPSEKELLKSARKRRIKKSGKRR